MKTWPTWMKKGVRFLAPASKLTPTCGPILGSVFRPPFLGPAATSGSKFLAPRHAFLSTLSVSNWHVETLLFIAAKGSILWGAMCLRVAWYFCCKRQNFRFKDLRLTPNFSRHLVLATCLGPSSWRLVLASHPDPRSRHLTLPPLRGTFVLAPHLTTRWRDDPTTSQSDQLIPKATPKLRPKNEPR